MEVYKDSINYKLLKSMEKSKFKFGEEVLIFHHQNWNKMMKDFQVSTKDIRILIPVSSQGHKYLFLDSQSLKTTIDRVLPYWNETIVPTIKSGKKVLVVAHGNSLRAIVKVLSNVSDADITELNIPTSIPLIYDFD